MSFNYSIELAGRKFNITNLYDYTMKMCKDYLIEDAVTAASGIGGGKGYYEQSEGRERSDRFFCVQIGEADLVLEREMAVETCKREGRSTEHLSDGYLESLATYRKICRALAPSGTLLMHGSAIAVGEAIIFIAPSGIGKSTHVRQWVKRYGDVVTIINDDKPLISTGCDSVLIHGTPWNGKHHLSTNASAPLKAVCILKRGPENKIKRISAEDAIPFLMEQTFMDEEPEMMSNVLGALDVVAGNCEFYELECLPNEEAAELVYETVFGVRRVAK